MDSAPLAAAYIDEPIFGALGAGAALYAAEDKFGPFPPLRRLCKYLGIEQDSKNVAFFIGVGFYLISRIAIGRV